jgi:hypothetical protein
VTTESKAYPVTIKGELTATPSRGWWLLKWLLGIPHYIVLFFLAIAFAIVWIISFFAILFTGKHPKDLFDFKVGVLRWFWRVSFYSYGALGTDIYPPFSLEPDPNYPADLDIPYPEKMSRGLVLVKWWLLAIPHYIIVSFLTGGWTWKMEGLEWQVGDRLWHVDKWQIGGEGMGLISVMAIFAGVCLLFAGKYPQQLFKLVVGFNRWVIRVGAYASLMTDEYPPFRLWDD